MSIKKMPFHVKTVLPGADEKYMYNLCLSLVFINGIPVVTTLGAWMLLGEKLTMIQAAGGCIVLLAVFLTNLPGARMSPQKFDS